MSNSRLTAGSETLSMDEKEFVCSDCGQEIAVNEQMKSAIEENGCPVCSAPVTPGDFV